MKILLSLIICSQVAGTCMPPFEWPETFNTQYDCMVFGYEESLKKMQEIGRTDVKGWRGPAKVATLKGLFISFIACSYTIYH